METERIAGSISLITRNMKIDGEVNGKENLTIEGNISGQDDIQIDGKFEGNLKLKGRLDIQQSARIKGSAVAKTMYIKAHFKAMFDARIRHFSAKALQSCFSDLFSLQSEQLQPDYVSS